MFTLSDGEEIMMVALFILTQYQSVTDGWTDRQTSVLQQYQHLHSLLCYRTGKNVSLLNQTFGQQTTQI